MNRYKRRCWETNETEVFLKSWKDHIYMNGLIKRGCNRNPLYFSICRDLQKEGYRRSMLEVMHKMRSMKALYSRSGSVDGVKDFKWYNEIEEIRKLEKPSPGERQASEVQMDQAMELFYGPYVKGKVPHLIQTKGVRDIIMDDEGYSDSDILYYTALKPTKVQVPNNSQVGQVSLPQSSRSDIENTSEKNILRKFLKEFQRSNREIEASDATMLELFKEQNDMFRTQTTLMMKLILK